MLRQTTPKLALVAETRLNREFSEYALRLAVRLDLEIIVLFIGQEEAGQRMTTAELEQVVEQEAAVFTARAWRKSVQVTTVVDSAARQTALQRLQKANPGIRFVLTSPDTAGMRQGLGCGYKLTVIRPG